jgi:hypothetical protein
MISFCSRAHHGEPDHLQGWCSTHSNLNAPATPRQRPSGLSPFVSRQTALRSLPSKFADTMRNMDSGLRDTLDHSSLEITDRGQRRQGKMDVYFSADVETDGPIPGPFSILSFALVLAGSFDGEHFRRPENYRETLYRELSPISENFEPEALRINGLDRARLCLEGESPEKVMTEACRWVTRIAGPAQPVLVAYPLSFDWTWLYWYFIRFSADGSPFSYSRCFDIKTAVAIKAGIPISEAGRSRIDPSLRSKHAHTHHAVDDAIAQAEIFANVFEWTGSRG